MKKIRTLAVICLVAVFLGSAIQPFFSNNVNGNRLDRTIDKESKGGDDETPTQTGDLIVNASEIFTIEGEKFILEGNIIVNSGGTLIIRNSDFTVNSHYKNQYWVEIYSQATLLVENSILREGPIPEGASWGNFGAIEDFRGGETVIRVQGEGAQLIMRNSTCELRPTSETGSTVTIESSYFGELQWKSVGSVKTRVTNSSIKIAGMWFTGGVEEDIEFSGLTGGDNQNIHLSVENATLDIENTLVESYVLALYVPYGERDVKKHLTVRESNIEEIWVVFPVGSDVKLRNMKPGFFTNWNIRDDMSGSGVPWNLTLVNTTIEKWKLGFDEIAEIENSLFQLDTWAQAQVTVKDSTLVGHHSRGGRIKLINTVVSNTIDNPAAVRLIYQAPFPEEHPPYEYEFENSTIGPHAGLEVTDDEIQATFRGSVSMLISIDKVYWFGGTVNREFPVLVRGEHNAPLANIQLTLLRPDNVQAWSGITDENGRASFNLTFGKDNYTEELTLKATIGNENISKRVGFFTSTPIYLSLKPPVAVSLYSPTNITTNSITLTWSQSNDTDFANYTIYQSTTQDLLGEPIKVIPDRTTTSYTVIGLSPDTTYYFTIRVYDVERLYNDSAQANGTTLAINQPPTVILYSSPNGAVINTTSVILSWSGSDPDANPLTYDVYLDTNPIPTTIVSRGQTDTTYLASGLLDNTTYYWEVIPNDGLINGSCLSGVWNFTIKIGIPSQPPQITYYNPLTNPTINEGESMTFNITVYDPDGIIPAVEWRVDDKVVGTGSFYIFVANHTFAGIYIINVTVTDGQYYVYHEWLLTVADVNIITPEGGNISFENIKLEFPPNAISINTTITITPISIVPPTGYELIGKAYKIEANITTFTLPITITLSYTEPLPEGVSEDDLAIWRKVNGEWVRLGGVVDKEKNTVSVEVTSLGEFAILYEIEKVEKPTALPWVLIVGITVIVVVVAIVGIVLRKRKKGE